MVARARRSVSERFKRRAFTGMSLRHARDIVTAALASGRPLPTEVIDTLLLPRMGDDLHRRVAASPGIPTPIIGSLTLDSPPQVRAGALTNPACPPLAVAHVAVRFRPTEALPHQAYHRHLALHHPACPPRIVADVALDPTDPARLSAWSSPALPLTSEVLAALDREPAPTWIAIARHPELPEPLWDLTRNRLHQARDHAVFLSRHRVPDAWWGLARRRPDIADAALPTVTRADVLDDLIHTVPAQRAVRVVTNPAAHWRHLTAGAGLAGQPLHRVAGHPATPPDVLEQLAATVPEISAGHPRTPPDVLVRLAGSNHVLVCQRVARNPALPADQLARLQLDPALAAALVRNPATDDQWARERLQDATRLLASQFRHRRPSRQAAGADHPTLF